MNIQGGEQVLLSAALRIHLLLRRHAESESDEAHALFVAGHDLQDLFVGFPHALAAELADVGDGVLNALGEDAVSAVELMAAPVHLQAENGGVDCGGDFGGAGGLGAVADHAADDRKGVDDGVLDHRAVLREQIGNAGAGCAAGGHRAAEGGQLADGGLFVNGAQVGDSQRTLQRFVALAVFPGVFDHGQGDRQALVATAGVDDDRHLAAAHARVAARGGKGARADSDVMTIGLQQRAADIGTPAGTQPLVRDGRIALNLPADHAVQILDFKTIGELADATDIKQAVIRLRLLRADGHVVAEARAAVKQDLLDVRMALADVHGGVMGSGVHGHLHVQQVAFVHAFHADGGVHQKLLDFGVLRFVDAGQHLKRAVLVAGDDACGDGGLDALQTAGVRNGHAFDILDDVAADTDKNALGHIAQLGSRPGGAVCQGDRLGAAGGHL